MAPASQLLCALIVFTALAAPAGALGASTSKPSRTAVGTLAQLQGRGGCLVARFRQGGECAHVRALRGAAPFLGSNAIAISRDGKHVYSAAFASDAVGVFKRVTRASR